MKKKISPRRRKKEFQTTRKQKKRKTRNDKDGHEPSRYHHDGIHGQSICSAMCMIVSCRPSYRSFMFLFSFSSFVVIVFLALADLFIVVSSPDTSKLFFSIFSLASPRHHLCSHLLVARTTPYPPTTFFMSMLLLFFATLFPFLFPRSRTIQYQHLILFSIKIPFHLPHIFSQTI